MTAVDDLLAEELQDTITEQHRRRGYRPVSEREGLLAKPVSASRSSSGRANVRTAASRSETARLTRDLVGRPTPPRQGVCGFCGGPAPHRTVCDAHSDLPQLDPSTGVHVTTATATRSSR